MSTSLAASGPTLAPGCTTDDECGPTEVCRNTLCLDPCAVINPCAPSAECQVSPPPPDLVCLPHGFTSLRSRYSPQI